MGWQLFDRIQAFLKAGNIYRSENLFTDQTQLDRITSGGDFLNLSNQHSLLQQTNLQINRLERYKDFDQMDEVGEISLALDLYADEATLIDSEVKHSLLVKASSLRVKKELEDLFYNTLLIDNWLRPAVRYLCKYGDLPVEVVPDNNRTGVNSIRQMNVYNFTRVETKYGDLVGFFYQDDMAREPQWMHPWQVMHARLTSFESIYQPYGRCQEFGTRVLTPDGYKNIENFKPNDDIYVFYNNELVRSRVVATCHSGDKEIYEIKTKHYKNRCSANHPIMIRKWNKIDGKWKSSLIYKRADEIQIGDEFVIPKVENNNKYIKLGYVGNNEIVGDEKFARLFGFLTGDGWIKRSNGINRGVDFALGECENINKYYIEFLDKYSPNKVRTYKDKNAKSNLVATKAVTHSTELSYFLENHGFIQGCKNKRVPDWIFKSPKSVKIAFINGLLDADGSVNVDKWGCKRLQVELSNYELIVDLKMLVHDIGWKCGHIMKRRRPSDKMIHGKEYNRSDSWYFYFYYSDLFKLPKKNFGWGPNARRKECEKYGEDIKFEKVISISVDGISPTADIQVEHKASNFIANGIVVHNSVLDGSRKHFKQLRLMEDAALVYRITRAPERRVFTIPVGSIPQKDVPQYMLAIARAIKKKKFFDPASGDVNERWNPLIQEDDYFLPQRCISAVTRIPLMDSTEKTVKELVEEYGHMDKEFWIYSYDHTLGKIVPAKAKACISPKNQQMVRVNIDNGEYIECTPDHKFMSRDGEWVEAQDLKSGQSLMPLYRRKRVYYGKSDYEQVKQPNGKWEWTHKISLTDVPKDHVRHHVDFNRFNSSPDNLEPVHFVEHRKIHNKHANDVLSRMSDEERSRGINNGIVKWNNDNPNLRKVVASKGAKKAWEKGKYDHIRPEDYKTWVDIEDYKDVWKKLIYDNGSIRRAVKAWNSDPKLKSVWKANHNVLIRKITKQWGYNSIEEFANIIVKLSQNHKHLYKHKDIIISLVKSNGPGKASELWNNNSDLYGIWKANPRAMSKIASKFGVESEKNAQAKMTDVEILEGIKQNGSVKKFYSNNDVSESTCYRVLKRNGYNNVKELLNTPDNHKVVSVEWLDDKQDTYCLYVEETNCFFTSSGVLIHNSDGNGPTVDTLPGAQNLDEIADIEYFKKKMVSGLKIPFSRVGIGDASENDGEPLSKVAPEFSKAVEYVQNAMVMALKKVAIIHLSLKGYSLDDIKNFDLNLTKASAIDELYRMEVWASRADTIEALKATELFPDEWLLRRFTNMTDDEIQQMIDEREAKELEEFRRSLEAGGEEGAMVPPIGDEDLLGGLPALEGFDYELENKVINESKEQLKISYNRDVSYDSGVDYLVNVGEFDKLEYFNCNGEKVIIERAVDGDDANNAIEESKVLILCESDIQGDEDYDINENDLPS